jgi:hypothetical protein
MRAGQKPASSRPGSSQPSGTTITSPATTPCTLPFVNSPLPDMGLTFLPRPQPQPRKRSRAVADIDGEHSCLQKKKRRLRLFLITSRLSPQFSHPATNIVDRGSSKIAVWAKQKSLGRNLLRKAAILNHIRRGSVAPRGARIGFSPNTDAESRRSSTTSTSSHVWMEQEREQEELALAKLEFDHGSVDTYTRPVSSRTPSVPPAVAIRSGGRFVISGSPSGSPSSSRSSSPSPPPSARALDKQNSTYRSPNEDYAYPLPRAQIPRREYLPLPPSPLGISNYDALDVDEDILDPYSRFDDEDEDLSTNVFYEDEESDSVPFSPSAVTSTSSSTLQTGASQVLNIPVSVVRTESETLSHNEPVFGDYDQVDDGADAVWPNFGGVEATTTITGSTSPDFNALFATAPSSKRTDSFATSPNFRPTMPKVSALHNLPSPSPHITSSTYASTSPNFTATSLPPYASTNYTQSPASTSTISAFEVSPISPNLLATAMSPYLPSIDEPARFGDPLTQRRMSALSDQQPDERITRHHNNDRKRKR